MFIKRHNQWVSEVQQQLTKKNAPQVPFIEVYLSAARKEPYSMSVRFVTSSAIGTEPPASVPLLT